MGIDASIYSNSRPVEMPSLFENAQKGMALSNMVAQQAQARQAAEKQMIAKQAFAANTGADGNLNQSGFLSSLGRLDPQAAYEYKQKFAEDGKKQAEAETAKMDSIHKTVSVTMPAMQYLAGLPEQQRAQAYPSVIKQLADQGVDTSKMPGEYDPGHFRQTYVAGMKMKPMLEAQLQQSQIGENNAKAVHTGLESEKLRMEMGKRSPELLGQNDPAKLVPGLVPKEHQAAVFKEIDAAENTKRMSQEIIASFDKAAKENTVMKTGGGYLRTPASVLALHQAMQPTFKDLEGTVRQAAMDNTFKNITPAPGDSAYTIQTKRKAVLEYLQSKASAPIARAYGIDLAKYDSTRAYEDAPKNEDDKDGGIGQKSAYAAALTPQDAEAIHWAQKNQGDPRAQKILDMHGAK